jgi:hypothetical protein
MNRVQIWKEEKGFAFPFLAVILPVLLIASVFIFDLGKVLLFRHQLQSIADSLSLAGASSRSVQSIMGSGYNVTGFEGPDHQPEIIPGASAIVGYKPIIDPAGAQLEAQSAFVKNEPLMQSMRKSGEKVTNWAGNVEGNTKFSVTVSGEVQTVMWGKVKKLIGETDGGIIPIQVKATAGIETVP